MSIAAIVVSVCALSVSLVQTLVMRAQQHAAVWPRLTTDLSVNVAPDSLTLTVRNAGVGPAEIGWAQVTLDGVPVADWTTLVSRTAPAGRVSHDPASMVANSVTGDVLVPGERHVALRLTGPPAQWMARAAGRVGLHVCYCSVFARCWRLENPSLGARVPDERVTAVSACRRPRTPVV